VRFFREDRTMRRFCLALHLLAVAAVAPPAYAQQIVLTSDGGDAWTFRKRIEGEVTGGRCDEISVSGPAASVVATQLGASFVAVLPLAEGVNAVRASCWRDGSVAAASSPQRWSVRLKDAPKAVPRVAPTHRGLVLDAGASETGSGRTAPIIARRWVVRAASEELNAADGPAAALASGRRVQIAVPEDGTYDVELTVTDALGRSDAAIARMRVEGGKAMAVDPASDRPRWIDNAVVYGAVPFLFGARGLADVAARLDAIRGLGATAIWLSPVMESPGEDFGYAVVDPFSVRRSYGGEAGLRALVQAAHGKGLRVLLDLVPNHLSELHPYHADAARRGPASAYAGFFDREDSGAVTSYFDWSHLKNLNFDNDEVQRYVIEASLHWIRHFDVDGFRVDASWGIRERAPEFWPRWRAALKRVKPDLLLLAESSSRDPYYLSHGFDAAYDWTDRLGQWAWQGVFEAPDVGNAVRQALESGIAGREGAGRTLRFLDNNDTGARFVTRHGIGMTRVAASMLLTLPGIPLIYAGQEIGAAYEPYGPRAALDWNSDPHGLNALYSRLVALRSQNPALRGSALRLVGAASGSAVAYMRPGDERDQDVIVVLNFSADPASVDIAESDLMRFIGGEAVDLISGETARAAGEGTSIDLPGFGARLLRARARNSG
jgi:cyclomaltodextrinase